MSGLNFPVELRATLGSAEDMSHDELVLVAHVRNVEHDADPCRLCNVDKEQRDYIRSLQFDLAEAQRQLEEQDRVIQLVRLAVN